MQLEIVERDGTVVISITGFMITFTDRTELKKTVSSLLLEKKRLFVFNLEGVKLINTTGIGFLMSCLKEIRKTKGQLVLSNVPCRVMCILTITKLDTIFDVTATVDEAVSKLKETEMK